MGHVAAGAALHESVRDAGVVGAGGAGFPAHVKAASAAEYVIANGAECEPLLHKDYEVMVHAAHGVVHGLRLLMAATGARHGIIGIKEKNRAAAEAVNDAIDGQDLGVHLLGDFYPSGDEYILVYESTGRLIPPQGIPLDVGVVVNNVETLLNVSAAAAGTPVTRKYVTVTGAVQRPSSFAAPVGMSFRDAITAAGGATTREFAVFVGGIMMGRLETDLERPITKTCAGLVVLPLDHTLVVRKSQPEHEMHRIGKSACDQCSYCTELCPRFTLGYDVQPHKVMRSLGFTGSGDSIWNQFASLCCGCGLCTLYACPEALFPKEACDQAKRDMKAAGLQWGGPRDVRPHPMYEYRRTPVKQLVKRLGIEEYDMATHFLGEVGAPRQVRIPMKQHIGAPAIALVNPGEQVRAGQLIGEIPANSLGARVHASIDGVVEEVGDDVVISG
jgi:Na+-translocating ferredoxin:NAD+ oxidoreductase RnfC subunit